MCAYLCVAAYVCVCVFRMYLLKNGEEEALRGHCMKF